MQRERVRLTLETAPSDVPGPVRLKRLMKALGRYYGWRCKEIEWLKEEKWTAAPEPEEKHS